MTRTRCCASKRARFVLGHDGEPSDHGTGVRELRRDHPAGSGWLAVRERAEWDAERALFPERVFAFLKSTQPRLWRS